jgi:hypothetical protein
VATIQEKMGHLGSWSVIPLELHFHTRVVSTTYDLCVIVQVSLFATLLRKNEPESYAESGNCGDMAKFVSNRCHIP